MAETRYLTDDSGVCATWHLDEVAGSPTVTVVLSPSRDWDGGLEGTVPSGNWNLFLRAKKLSDTGGVKIRLVSAKRVNSSCVTQETLASALTTSTFITTSYDTHLIQFNPGNIVFESGDKLVLEIGILRSSGSDDVQLEYSQTTTRITFPDIIDSTLEVSSAATSTTAFDLEVSVLGTVGQSGVTFNLTVQVALEFTAAGVSDWTSARDGPDANVETGVFLELATGGVSLAQFILLDVILQPFPRVIPVSMDGRARWCQYRFDVDGDVDVLIAGFVLYVVASGQLNVDEP